MAKKVNSSTTADQAKRPALKKGNLREVGGLFFKLGCLAFGGPAAHIAMIESEVVTRRKWMDRQHFLDLVGATNLIPGPNSTEMTMHCGHERAGVRGLFVAGFTFIFPAVVLTGLLAWAYTEYSQLPQVEPFIYGIKPAVLAIIAGAIWKLGKKAVKGAELAVLGILTLAVSLAGVSEIIALLGAGLAGMLYYYPRSGNKAGVSALLPILPGSGLTESATSTSTAPPGGFLGWLTGSSSLAVLTHSVALGAKALPVWQVAWSFLKVGAILYGSGYVLFAYLDAELVARGWLSRPELMDAVAVGQLTPGPVLSTATFIGYQLAGWQGALAATLGIFLPSFLFVWLLNPLVPRMRKSRLLRGFLDSVNVAAVAVMATVLIRMGQDTLLTDWRPGVIAAFGFLMVFVYKGPQTTLLSVLGGGLLGYALKLV